MTLVNIAGLVLAGGQSRRMGQDKRALMLPVSGISLLAHSLDVMAASGASPLLLSIGHTDDDNNPCVSDQYHVLDDEYDDCGPLAGIHRMLQYGQQVHSSWQGCLVMPVDMPDLTSALLKNLVDFGTKQHCSCYFQASYLPLFLNLQGQHHSQVMDYVSRQLTSQGDYSVKGLCRAVKAIAVPIEQTEALENINSPNDWQCWQAAALSIHHKD